MTVERRAVDVPGGRLALVLHVPSAPRPVPCVIACHGLSASKDSDKYLLLGEGLPAAGLALARFDFRGCGESTGREEDTTVATRIEDAEAVLASLAVDARLARVCGLLGSSLGGFVALHVAARAAEGRTDPTEGRADPTEGRADPTEGRVGAVVTWNAPSDLHGLGKDEHRDRRGLGVPFFLELATHRFDAAPAGVARHLVVQGELDDVVSLDHATVLHARAAEPCDLVVVPGGDHRLTDPAHRGQAVDVSLAWFRRFLLAEGSAS